MCLRQTAWSLGLLNDSHVVLEIIVRSDLEYSWSLRVLLLIDDWWNYVRCKNAFVNIASMAPSLMNWTYDLCEKVVASVVKHFSSQHWQSWRSFCNIYLRSTSHEIFYIRRHHLQSADDKKISNRLWAKYIWSYPALHSWCQKVDEKLYYSDQKFPLNEIRGQIQIYLKFSCFFNFINFKAIIFLLVIE